MPLLIQNLQNVMNEAVPYLTRYALEILGALVILIVGWVLANWFGKRVQKWLEKSNRIDETLIPIFSKTTKAFVLIITILAVLNNFGVQTASIIAVLGAAGLAIGLALQGTLSNVASGVMLLIFRPFNMGDAVTVGGTTAIIDEIGLFITKLHTFDNINVYLPNSKIWGNEIQNYSQNDKRRVDLVFGIGYDDDMDKAIRIINEVFSQDERILKDPAPLIAVSELADSSVNIMARPWTKTSDFFQTKLDLMKKMKERFDEEGINIPYPQRDVHLFQSN
ncbi:MAG TPA: mechanosensitive ion channel domain-containing protein [Balneolales bacterium]|nr:mechanosensitive ion channel domain-containing protein [Balneolales bacterium]